MNFKFRVRRKLHYKEMLKANKKVRKLNEQIKMTAWVSYLSRVSNLSVSDRVKSNIRTCLGSVRSI